MENDAHKTVDDLALKKEIEQNKNALREEANKDIRGFTLASISYGFRKGLKVGFIAGLIVSFIIYLILN